jgi:hypothetical protein
MPTKRTRVGPGRVVLGHTERVQLLEGDCGLFCSLGRRHDTPWPVPSCLITDMERVRFVWAQHRDELLAGWRIVPPDVHNWDIRGWPRPCGSWGVPAFAEILFDGVPVPRARRSWPEPVRASFDTIVHNASHYLEQRRRDAKTQPQPKQEQ